MTLSGHQPHFGRGENLMRNELVVAMLGIALAACAGRDPQPIATVQPQDQTATCGMISAEI